ncbi:MAG: hypothetical protein BWY15_00303 [Firmicutes bacterium ADurb.Bin193]|nr:MAG: hypothetical protein BWY15_00303 [Firmicutes bacterium ADurb.Bin193]
MKRVHFSLVFLLVVLITVYAGIAPGFDSFSGQFTIPAFPESIKVSAEDGGSVNLPGSASKPYTIKSVTLLDSKGKVVDALIPNGKIAKVTIAKKTDATNPAVLIIALYRDKKLDNVITVNIAGTGASGTEADYPVDFTIPDSLSHYSAKLMVWNPESGSLNSDTNLYPDIFSINRSLVYEKVSEGEGMSAIGYFGTSPESPDGSKVAYLKYDRKPKNKDDKISGSLYICNSDLTNHVKIRDIQGINTEDGAHQIWVDNNTIAYSDYTPGKGNITYIVDTSGKEVHPPIQANLGHGDAPNGTIALLVDKEHYPNGSTLGPNGIYIYKNGTVTKVVDLVDDLGKLKNQLTGSDNPNDWMMYHAQLSTNGTYIAIRLDTSTIDSDEYKYVITFKTDGTDIKIFENKKPLHQQWYDDSTLFAHDKVAGANGQPKHTAKRFDRNGTFIETLAAPGNHPGMSPDRKYLASETLYNISPIIMKLYRAGNTKPIAVLVNEEAGKIWTYRMHMDPAFSRDGKKVYFNMPMGDMIQAYRVDISGVIDTQN